jgi:helicase
VSGDGVGNDCRIAATLLGKRVSELYLDPLTAHHLIKGIGRAEQIELRAFSLIQLVCHTLEMRPWLRVKTKEWEDIQEELLQLHDQLLEPEPTLYDPRYEGFIRSVKTALMLRDWIEEKQENYLLEQYSVRPGELRVKVELADWLLYSTSELARILERKGLRTEIMKLRLRLKAGAKEELLALLKLKRIGRVRARRFFANGIKNIGDVKDADIVTLSQLIGKKIAIDVKKQVGQEFDPEKVKVARRKRKGQISLNDFT